MNSEYLNKKLNQLLSKSSSYYKQRIVKSNLKFDFTSPVILFGAAKLAREFIPFFNKKGTKIIAMGDNNKSLVGSTIERIKILCKSDIQKIYGLNIQIVVTSLYYPEIIKDLLLMGFTHVFNPLFFTTLYAKDFDVLVWKNDINQIIQNRQRIKSAYSYLSDHKSRRIFIEILKFRLLLKGAKFHKVRSFDVEEYFDKSIIKLSDKEVFLDGGAYDGDTIKKMISQSKNKFESIYAFEPDNSNYKKLASYSKELDDQRIIVYKLGLGNKRDILNFTDEGNLQSKIFTKGKNQIKIIPIDSFADVSFTYIKLDIEGYEKKALLGSRKIIRKVKPKLVICIYHKANDLWELPFLIKKIRPDYTLYLRHYSNFILDTICYAI